MKYTRYIGNHPMIAAGAAVIVVFGCIAFYQGYKWLGIASFMGVVITLGATLIDYFKNKKHL